MQQFRGTHFIVRYADAVTKQAIRNNKFHYHTQSARQLAKQLDAALNQFPNPTLITIPSSPRRTRTRGYHHLDTILQHSQYQDRVRSDLIRKTANTPAQSHVSKTVRLTQQRGAFMCNQNAAKQLVGTVILLDDVVTTGATMAAARATLAPQLPPNTKLICLAIAH